MFFCVNFKLERRVELWHFVFSERFLVKNMDKIKLRKELIKYEKNLKELKTISMLKSVNHTKIAKEKLMI